MSTILEKGRYKIPQGCVVDVFGNEIIVRESRNNKRRNDDRRCKDCKFYVSGQACNFSDGRKSMVCSLRPKEEKGMFYAMTAYHAACEQFKDKED